MTPEQLAEIEARAAAATPGPWESGVDIYDDGREICADVCDPKVSMLATLGTDVLLQPDDAPDPEAWAKARASQASRDATFIAAARSDVPALIAEIRRLWAERGVA